MIVINCQAQNKVANAVIDHDFPDPTIITFNGKYYAYATNSTVNGIYAHIQVAVSEDRTHWNYIGDALPEGASWGKSQFWAPHVTYDPALKQFIMYYSAQSKTDTLGKCIGVAFSEKPEGPFIDKGTPLISGKGYVNIDPFAMIDPQSGKKLLYWGSGKKPIKVQELNADWASFKLGIAPKPILSPSKSEPYSSLVEGSWVDFNGGYYYLYYSGDNCCGSNANYAVMVARSKLPEGPFERFGDYNKKHTSVILEKNKEWLAPGHNSIFRDKKGNIYIAYHAISKNRNPDFKTRSMLIAPLVYKDGWPVVCY